MSDYCPGCEIPDLKLDQTAEDRLSRAANYLAVNVIGIGEEPSGFFAGLSDSEVEATRSCSVRRSIGICHIDTMQG